MPPDQTLLRTFPGLALVANPAGARATQAASAGPRPAATPLPEPARTRGGSIPRKIPLRTWEQGGRGSYWREKKGGRGRENLEPPQASRPLGRRRPAATAKRFQILAGRWVAGVQHNRGRDYRARLSRPLEQRLAVNAVAMATRWTLSITAPHILGGGNFRPPGRSGLARGGDFPPRYSPPSGEMVTPSRSVAVVTVWSTAQAPSSCFLLSGPWRFPGLISCDPWTRV